MKQYRIQVQTRDKGYGDYKTSNLTDWICEELDENKLIADPVFNLLLRCHNKKFSVKIGDRFIKDNQEFILAAVGSFDGNDAVQLISLDDGTRVSDFPVMVDNYLNISKQEFSIITHGAKFERKN